jgi:hypothetical protein
LQTLAANQHIQLRLSSGRGREIVYQIGDKPYTDLCDYQSSCAFQCAGTGTDTGTDTGTETDRTTYTQLHTHTNLYQIIDRIRQLFRESTYYHQIPLIRAINIQREYPIDHIYATLTYMIEHRNELLVDPWGRSGYLVNHGDVYLFQPREITDETVSIHDRSVPVEYRREHVIMEVPPTIIPDRTDVFVQEELATAAESSTNAAKANANANANANADKPDQASIAERLALLQENIDHAMGGEPPTDEPAKQWKWYSHAAGVFDADWKRIHGWKDAELEKIVVEHAVESLMPTERRTLVTEGAAAGYKPLQTYLAERWVASTRPGDTRHGWWMLVDHPKEPLQLFVSPPPPENDAPATATAQTDTYTGVPCVATSSTKSTVLRTSDLASWTKAEPEDVASFPINISMPNPANLANQVGYFSIFDHKQMVFKMRDMTKKRNIGARMDSAGKIKVIALLNAVQDKVTYTIESTKRIHQMGICVMLEAFVRRPRPPGSKRLFLSPEEAILLH